MRQKPKTPYQRLLEDVMQFACKVKYAHRKTMWRYPKKKLDQGWSLASLAERVKAADQLGYDVRLVWDDGDGLLVQYTKRPDIPIGWA